MDAIEADFDNIRAAWHWATERQAVGLLAGAAESLSLFCIMRGRAVAGESLLRSAAETLAPRDDRIPLAAWRKLNACWLFILEWHEQYRARPSLEPPIKQALSLARSAGDQAEIAFALK